MTPQEFAAKWRGVLLKERSVAQEHFIDLCRLVGHQTPIEADPDGATSRSRRASRRQMAATDWPTLVSRPLRLGVQVARQKPYGCLHTTPELSRTSTIRRCWSSATSPNSRSTPTSPIPPSRFTGLRMTRSLSLKISPYCVRSSTIPIPRSRGKPLLRSRKKLRRISPESRPCSQRAASSRIVLPTFSFAPCSVCSPRISACCPIRCLRRVVANSLSHPTTFAARARGCSGDGDRGGLWSRQAAIFQRRLVP